MDDRLLRPIGENPEPFGRLERLTLEKTRFGLMHRLDPQVARDLEVEFLADHISRGVVAKFEADILSYKDGEDEQEVWSVVEVLPHKRYVLGLSVPFALVGVVLFMLGLHLYAALAFALAFVVAFAYVAARPAISRKPFVVKAERWHRFPENTVAFPENLGRPVIQIVTDVRNKNSSY